MRLALMRPVLLIGLALLFGARGAFAADAKTGAALALRWCATCHIVGPDQTRGNADVPTFASIAKRPGFSADRLANFLRDPHPKMPDMALSRSETDDIAAYIATLK